MDNYIKEQHQILLNICMVSKQKIKLLRLILVELSMVMKQKKDLNLMIHKSKVICQPLKHITQKKVLRKLINSIKKYSITIPDYTKCWQTEFNMMKLQHQIMINFTSMFLTKIFVEKTELTI